MNELDLLIEKHYQKRSKEKFNADDLIKLVEQTLDRVYDATLGSAELKEEAAPGLNNVSSKTAKEFLLSLPKFGPNESWGRPGSVDRETMNKVFGVIGGEASIEAKISFLGRIVDETNQITSPRRIIGSLILLESLSTIITTFSAAPAGFVFEGYMAALLRGTQEAGVDPDKGNLPIQDLIAFNDIKGHEGTPVSLKLLSPTTPIHGSYTNLVDSMDEFGKMVYLIARKVGDRIVLEEFTLTQDNFIDAISFTATGKRKKAKSLFRLGQYSAEKSIQILNKIKSWPEKYALLSRTAGYTGAPIERPSKQVKKPAEKESPKLKLGELPAEYVPPQGDYDFLQPINESSTESRKQTLLKEGSDKTQWSISDKQLPKLVNYVDVSYKELGSLPVSAKEIEKVAEREMQKLNDSLLELFTATKSLSDNINDYFTVEKRNSAIKSGNKAIDDTVQIQKSLRAEILKDDKK